MNIPEQLKIEPNMIVVFKKHFDFNGLSCNAIAQRDDGTMVFFDTDKYHTSGEFQVAYKKMKGNA